MKLYRTLALAAVLSIGVAGGSFAASKPKPAAKTTTAPATQYECAHCNIKMSAKEAKANGMKCTACGAKLTVVKKPAKSTSQTKKA